jgi:hypothetical protein
VYENLCAKLGSHGATKAKNPDPDIPPAISPDIPAYNRTETVERYPYFENEYEYGPLLKTKWHQQSPFNNFRTDDAPAGCMAISCGQIMAYHRHPIYMAATGHYYTWDASVIWLFVLVGCCEQCIDIDAGFRIKTLFAFRVW